MIKSPITNKAARSVKQYQVEVEALRLRAHNANTMLAANKSALLSKKSMLFGIFAAGTYLGRKPKVVKVADPKKADRRSFPLYSLLNTALSVVALHKKSQLLTKNVKTPPFTHTATSRTES